ncbi:DUF309 domain-containing protein [Sutcliffiella rhizosphaerae]|uniref:DUF309 domain-containing protein n=1 Tax=Sutcliffiella rhizosphaerae TaxID=2880967 RepID=A0ABN8ADL6_9BACI|nr:DUF309 domain-containing protein [Sutcliffiella rhizosphaerae]CAG9622346.1 hypothetical protein BACCIP111883_03137 [Sutcliffiella rhizosphaerae]
MYPQAYLDYLYHFHCDRDYFECHEVLEEYWKEKEAQERDIHWVGLIQIAVGLYHQRRGNLSGAKKMLQNAVHIVTSQSDCIQLLGLDSVALEKLLNERILDIEQGSPYRSFNLPIEDSNLLISCQSKAASSNKIWGAISDLTDAALINRHSLRDRTEVILERQRQLDARKKKKDSNG